MTNNELFNKIKSISERLKEIFNPIQESEIIYQFYIGLLEDLVYRNIIKNFFNNLECWQKLFDFEHFSFSPF